MDIDIDIAPSTKPSQVFYNAIKASMVENNQIKPHPVGFYFQKIPKDKISNLSAIPYKKAEKMGYLKIDFLNVNLLTQFKNKKQLSRLMKKEPTWKYFKNKNIVDRLFHLAGHSDLLKKVEPSSVVELADALALMRPGKMKLLGRYLKNRESMRQELYKKRLNSDMRKSHCVSYALLIIAQLNLMEERNEII